MSAEQIKEWGKGWNDCMRNRPPSGDSLAYRAGYFDALK
ncbi:hypothetical protein DM82_4377 [Burkholderia oklahomensis]|uniref:Uncharacterized protein n=1 Tax=Burkholderia oklahomensis TaxID=342113 RepID=A0AAI8BDI5_9BURK|nr:hypothetical protein DM82_4377 [Burkholderia oklahomensis]